MLMRIGLVAVAIVLVTALVPVLESEGMTEPASEVSGNTTIFGFVADVSTNLEKNIPFEDVVVTLYDSDRSPLGTCVTDTEGRFELTYPDGTGRYLTFEHERYTVQTLPSDMVMVDGQFVRFDVRDGMLVDGKYMLTSVASGYSPVGMRITMVEIAGYVYGKDGSSRIPLEDAQVSLVSSSGETAYAYTNDKGYFSASCYIGTYELTVSCKGFMQSSAVEVETGDNALEIVLERNDYSLLFGLDTPHAGELIGILVVLTVILVIGLIHTMGKRGRVEIEFINDLESPRGEEEEEDLRYP